jgi:hypothetical protein
MALIFNTLLGAFFPKTDAGTMVGNPLIGNPEAVMPVAMPAFTVELKNVRLLNALLDDMLNRFLYV